MAKLNVFAPCRLRSFASLVAQRLGVQVRLRGREICVRFGKPPVIFMPNLEMAREQDLLPLYGFTLHEAGHLKFTSPNVVRDCPNYMLKMLHNAIEDVFIESRLEKHFPGARAMLTRAYVEGVARVCDGKPIVPERSYLHPDSRIDVVGFMRELGMDVADETLVDEVAKRLEIERAGKLWIVEQRKYPLPLNEWSVHPWHEVFREETTPPARSTRQAYEQAERIIARLGVKPVLPNDSRPVDAIKEAQDRKAAARQARKALRDARRERDEEIRRCSHETAEYRKLLEAMEQSQATKQALDAADPAADNEDLRSKVEEAADACDQAREEYRSKRSEIAAEVNAERAAAIQALEQDARTKRSESDQASKVADAARELIKARDAKADALIDKNQLDELIAAIFERHKQQGLADELKEALPAGTVAAADPELEPARKYCPFDRSQDRVVKIMATAPGRAGLESARHRFSSLIQETTERLRRLHPPQLTRVKNNAERGRLDPRQAYKVGLGMHGAPVDLSKVWRTLDESKDAKVAVSLLIDCSGSMGYSTHGGETRIALAQQAAACLSEVMSALRIPHEILGHTTSDEGLAELGITPEDREAFSRLIPFRGYLFKEFAENAAPAGVFSEFELNSNVDGEAVLWAAQRLADRKEKMKILIVICDGLPNAELSNTAELERHLFVTCKQIEAREREGLHLAALGIGEDRVRKFYKNADVLNGVADLPAAVLRIVEGVMARSLGR